jgi:hypothetical protein
MQGELSLLQAIYVPASSEGADTFWLSSRNEAGSPSQPVALREDTPGLPYVWSQSSLAPPHI